MTSKHKPKSTASTGTTSKSSSEKSSKKPKDREPVKPTLKPANIPATPVLRSISPVFLEVQTSGFSDFVRASSWTRHLKGAEPPQPKQVASSDQPNADIVTHDTAKLMLRYKERTQGNKETSRRFEPITFDPDGTLDRRDGGITDVSPKTAKAPPPVKYTSPNARSREETFHNEHKDSGRVEKYFLEHEFKDLIDGELEELKKKRFKPAELAAGLLYAVGLTQALLGDYKDVMVDAGEYTSKSVQTVTLSSLDWTPLASARHRVLPLDELDLKALAHRSADCKTSGTIAVLGDIKERLSDNLRMYKRRKELRHWIDHPDRERIGGEPTKLHQSQFTHKDMNYAAWYARIQRNAALDSYKELYKMCEEYKMIDRTVKITGCPPPEEILDLEAKHEDFVDFNEFKETELLYYEWEAIDVPHKWRGKTLVTDSFGDPDEARKQKNWRFSIALWAHNANMLRRAGSTLSLAYDEFWSSASDDDAPSMGIMIGDLPELSDGGASR